jgi:hypothetical protein
LFANFTHIALRYTPQESYPTAVQQSDKDSWSNSQDDAANFFFRFFFQNKHLFSGDLSQQFTVITTPGKPNPFFEKISGF